jgi:hypothetical protein
MKNELYQDELEQFLQDEVKQHRMYPSDHIWKNIRTEMHGYRAWPALTFISLFIITALTISTLLSNHPQQLAAAKPATTAIVHEQNSAAAITAKAEAPAGNYFGSIAGEHITAETMANLNTDDDASEQAVMINRLQPATLQPVLIAQVHADKAKATEKIEPGTGWCLPASL